MEDLVTKLTEALMMHAVDLFALTNSQVMILVETPSGNRFWSANGKLRNEFSKEGRVANRSWGMKEVVVESSSGTTPALPEIAAETSNAFASPQPKPASPMPSTPVAATAPSSAPVNPPRDALAERHEFLQQQQQQLQRPPQQRPQQQDQLFPEQPQDQQQKRSSSIDPMTAKRVRPNQSEGSGLPPMSGIGGNPLGHVNNVNATSLNQQQTPIAQFPMSTAQFQNNLPAAQMTPSSVLNLQATVPNHQHEPQFQPAMAHLQNAPMQNVPQMQNAGVYQNAAPAMQNAFPHFQNPMAPPNGQQQQQHQQQQLGALYDPSRPTEEPMSFPSAEAEKNRVAFELEELRKAGKLRFSWLEIDQVFLTIRRDDKTRNDVLKRISSYADLQALKADM